MREGLETHLVVPQTGSTTDSLVIQHLSASERANVGRDERLRVPRSLLGYFWTGPQRPDPVALLEGQSAARIQELVPIRYGRMLASPFTFFRGAALIMASDLAAGPRTDLQVQLCGDAHLQNFGGYGSPERRLIFDINDFDETHPGPFEWDVKRLVTSIELAGRENGISAKQRRRATLSCATAYRAAMARFARMGNLEVWYTHVDATTFAEALRSPGMQKKSHSITERAHRRTALQALGRLTEEVKGQRRFVDQPPLIVPVGAFAGEGDTQDVVEAMRALFRRYRQSLPDDVRNLVDGYQYVDLAHKVVGVGSVGTRCWLMLLSGRDSTDPLFIQFKEAGASVLEGFTEPSIYGGGGERVVTGQRMMQSVSDIFLGWTHADGDVPGERDYYFRQFRDWKVSADVAAMDGLMLRNYGDLCGRTLAKAHARTGDRIALSAYVGDSDLNLPNSFDRAMADFAISYADQNERDYAALQAAAAEGRIVAAEGL